MKIDWKKIGIKQLAAFISVKLRERGIEEEAGQIRKKYFTGKFVVGKGQAD